MPILYSCRHDGDQYRISKFNDDMNVESSYLCTPLECECPAGSRPTCRHRAMLPKFISREKVGTNWFLDFDRDGWVQMRLEEPASAARTQPLRPHSPTVTTTDFDSVDGGSIPSVAAIEAHVNRRGR